MRATKVERVVGDGPGFSTTDPNVPDGAYCFSGRTGLMFVCPCGCRSLGLLLFTTTPVIKATEPETGEVMFDTEGPRWKWDGNEDAPTLTPSIQRTGGCGWHGFLTAGVWRKC